MDCWVAVWQGLSSSVGDVMTVPLYPNDFRLLPKKVLRKFWSDHVGLDELRIVAVKEINNNPLYHDLKVIVSNLAKDKED